MPSSTCCPSEFNTEQLARLQGKISNAIIYEAAPPSDQSFTQKCPDCRREYDGKGYAVLYRVGTNRTVTLGRVN